MNKILLTTLFLAVLLEASSAVDSYLNELKTEAKKTNPDFVTFDAQLGKEIFFKKQMVDGKEISCTTCHSTNLSKMGLNVKTNKPIDPLSPSTNKTRLTDIKEMKKWLKRNFNDVYKREGTPLEKGNVLTFIKAN